MRHTSQHALKLCITSTAFITSGTALANPLIQNKTIHDIPATHWAREAVKLMVNKGFVLGYPDGTFRGTQPISRYEATIILSRMRKDQINMLSSYERRVYQKAMKELNIVQQQIEMLGQAVSQNNETLSKIKHHDTKQINTLIQQVNILEQKIGTLSQSNTLLASEVSKLKLQQAQAALESPTPPATTSTSKPTPQVDALFKPTPKIPVNLNAPRMGLSLYASGGQMPIAPGITIDTRLSEKGPLSAQIYGELGIIDKQSSRFGLNIKANLGKPEHDFNAYILLGPGASLTKQNNKEMLLDPFINAGLGAEYRMASNFSLFADISTQYFFNQEAAPFKSSEIDQLGFSGRVGTTFRF